MRNKKFLSLIAGLALLSPVLASCGPSDETTNQSHGSQPSPDPSPEPSPEPEPEPFPADATRISAIYDKAIGDTVVTYGIYIGDYTTGGTSHFFADGESAIYSFFGKNDTSPTDLVVGELYKLEGTVDIYSGLVQLKAPTITPVDKDYEVAEPVSYTLTADSTIDYHLTSREVKVKGEVESISSDNYGTVSLQVKLGSNSIQVRADNRNYTKEELLAFASINPGDTVELKGNAAFFIKDSTEKPTTAEGFQVINPTLISVTEGQGGEEPEPSFEFKATAAERNAAFLAAADGDVAGIRGEVLGVEAFQPKGNANIYVYDAPYYYRLKNFDTTLATVEVGKYYDFVAPKAGDDINFNKLEITDANFKEYTGEKAEAHVYKELSTITEAPVGRSAYKMTDAIVTEVTASNVSVTYSGKTYKLSFERGANKSAIAEKLASALPGAKLTANLCQDYYESDTSHGIYIMTADAISFVNPELKQYNGALSIPADYALTGTVEANTVTYTAGQVALNEKNRYEVKVDLAKPENLETLDNVKVEGTGVTLTKSDAGITLTHTFSTAEAYTGFSAKVKWNFDQEGTQDITVTVAEGVTFEEKAEVPVEGETLSLVLSDDYSNNPQINAGNTVGTQSSAEKVLETLNTLGADTILKAAKSGENIYTTKETVTAVKVGSSKKAGSLIFTLQDNIKITGIKVYGDLWNNKDGKVLINEQTLYEGTGSTNQISAHELTGLEITGELSLTTEKTAFVFNTIEITYQLI